MAKITKSAPWDRLSNNANWFARCFGAAFDFPFERSFILMSFDFDVSQLVVPSCFQKMSATYCSNSQVGCWCQRRTKQQIAILCCCKNGSACLKRKLSMIHGKLSTWIEFNSPTVAQCPVRYGGDSTPT